MLVPSDPSCTCTEQCTLCTSWIMTYPTHLTHPHPVDQGFNSLVWRRSSRTPWAATAFLGKTKTSLDVWKFQKQVRWKYGFYRYFLGIHGSNICKTLRGECCDMFQLQSWNVFTSGCSPPRRLGGSNAACPQSLGNMAKIKKWPQGGIYGNG